jgi:ribosomal protein S18 acetylase RimI-like enzyme
LGIVESRLDASSRIMVTLRVRLVVQCIEATGRSVLSKAARYRRAMPILLRSYTASYQREIGSLLRAHRWTEQYIEGQLVVAAALASSDNGAALVAAVDGSFAGFVTIEVHRWNGLAQLHGLAVRPEHLRQGVGSRLVEEAERIALEQNSRGIYVDTPIDNYPAQAFYVAQGYREDHRMSRYYADTLDGITYIKFFD